MKRFTLTCLWLLLLVGCSKDELSPSDQLVGTWRLDEEGSSPGAGYYTKAVPKKPLQSLQFTATGELKKQGERLSGLFDVPYYRVDSAQTGLRLHLMKSRQDTTGLSVALRLEGNRMRIEPPCFEGCHYGFVRIR